MTPLLLLLLLFHVVVVWELSLCMCNYWWITTTTKYYTVTTIIKQLMITKILNNICRFIWMLLLLLLWGLLYVIQKDHLWSKAWNVNEFKFGRGTYCGQWNPSVNWALISGRPLHQIIFITDWILPPPPFNHRSMEDCYTASFAWQTDPTPSSNQPYIYGRPLHHINFTYSIMHIYFGQAYGV